MTPDFRIWILDTGDWLLVIGNLYSKLTVNSPEGCSIDKLEISNWELEDFTVE